MCQQSVLAPRECPHLEVESRFARHSLQSATELPVRPPLTRPGLSSSPVPERFSIVHVTPYAWEARHEVNDFIAHVARELHGRGHRVAIMAPSESQARVRDSRRATRAAAQRSDGLFAGDEPPVLAVGEVLQLTSSRRRRLPLDVAPTISDA